MNDRLEFQVGGWLVLSALLGLTAACGYTVDQLAEDDELRNKVLKECLELGMQAKEEEKCRIAAEAQVEAIKRAAEGLFTKDR